MFRFFLRFFQQFRLSQFFAAFVSLIFLIPFSPKILKSARDDHGGTVSPVEPKHDAAAESKQQQQKAVVPERRQRSRSRGSVGGGGDGVLLNFYVPGLRLTRSKTAPRPGRGAMPPAVAQGAPTKAQPPLAAGKARLVAN
jgi:hypothetical protein